MFDEQLDIIKTGIVRHEYNAFWKDVSDRITGLAAKDVLVCATPYATGSAEETLLLKMLQACTLSPDQHNILTLDAEELLPWHALRSALQPKTVLLFGIMPQQLGVSALFRINEPNHFNGCTFIPTLGLTDMDQQPEAKKQLWNNGMKPTFIDKTS